METSNNHNPQVRTKVTILRHGESLHNLDRSHPSPDPPLTSKGQDEANQVNITPVPDLILISPMTRTIQTAIQVFGSLITTPESTVKIEMWPELREGYDHAVCNRGISKAELMAKFPFPALDFGACHLEWDYESHSFEGAMVRAEVVRRKLKELVDEGKYKHILLVSHRGFIAFLVKGERFGTCESRSYRVADDAEVHLNQYANGVDTGEEQDFGPTVLLPYSMD